MLERLAIYRDLSVLFKLFSHPDRIRILAELQNGELNVQELQAILKLPQARVSQHLAQLRDQQLLIIRREGRFHFCSLTNPRILSWILDGAHHLNTEVQTVENKEITDSI
jgi:DNA-binding transcriptional ArsR family regulator